MKKKRFIPNSKLPKGARLIKTVAMKLGNWNEQDFDAKLTRNGITWYRVKDGLGSYPREDWLADLPAGCCCVCYYNWHDEGFGTNYGTFEKALDGELNETLKTARENLEKAKARVFALAAAINKITKAL